MGIYWFLCVMLALFDWVIGRVLNLLVSFEKLLVYFLTVNVDKLLSEGFWNERNINVLIFLKEFVEFSLKLFSTVSLRTFENFNVF
jgi:hypothetical protein